MATAGSYGDTADPSCATNEPSRGYATFSASKTAVYGTATRLSVDVHAGSVGELYVEM